MARTTPWPRGPIGAARRRASSSSNDFMLNLLPSWAQERARKARALPSLERTAPGRKSPARMEQVDGGRLSPYSRRVQTRELGRTKRAVPVIGQGTWHLESGDAAAAIAALRRGF